MSARDRRLAEKYAKQGRESANSRADRKHKEKVEKRGGSVMSRREAMQSAIDTPRDQKSKDRARRSKRDRTDGSTAFEERDRKKFFGF